MLAEPAFTDSPDNNREDDIRDAISLWSNAMDENDLESILAAISNDYRGEHGKEGMRQLFKSLIDRDQLTGTVVDIENAAVTLYNDIAAIDPVHIEFPATNQPGQTLRVLFKDEGDAWRIIDIEIESIEPQIEPEKEITIPDEPPEGISLELLNLHRRFFRAVGDSPRPDVDEKHVPLLTSFHALIASTEKDDLVLADSVSMSLKPEGGEAFYILSPGREFAEGYHGELSRHSDRRHDRTLVVYVDSNEKLEPETTYTVRVKARSMSGAVLDEDESIWSFTTESAPETHLIEYELDINDGPDVVWKGEFFNGMAKPSFATSTREGGRLKHYEMMAEAREEYPHAWNLMRDALLSGFAFQHDPFKAPPNIVRERETRRITSIEETEEGVMLRVEDFFGHEQYGIESERPVSDDFHKGDEILIADGIQSARAHVISADDDSGTVVVTHFNDPPGQWQIEYPRPLPVEENPSSPGFFPPGGTYLRKFDPPGTPHYYWGRLHHEWDLLVKEFGFRVIPRFAYAPGDLSIDGRGGTTAKCLVQLHEVTRHITSHLIERYGEATLDWPWMILNEPDLMGLYWRIRDWEELQRFYDYTADAILRAFEDHGYDSDKVQVGGLELGAIAGLRLRLEDFLIHVSPNATGNGALDLNAAYADPRLDGKRSRRVEELCSANEGRGSPLDLLSIHSYNDSETAAAKLIRAKEIALEIDPEYFETLPVVSHETVPRWTRIPDPGAAEIYLGNGYFTTWGANFAGRQLQKAAEDARFSYGGEAPLMAWTRIRRNFSTLNDVVRIIQLEDRDEIIPGPMFHFANLLSTMRDDFYVLQPKEFGGYSVGGFASTTDDDLRVLLYSHNIWDKQSRSEVKFNIVLNIAGITGNSAGIDQYRIDRSHNSYYEIAKKLREAGGDTNRRVFTEEEFKKIAEHAALQVTTASTHELSDGIVKDLTVELSGNGVNFLIIRPKKTE